MSTKEGPDYRALMTNALVSLKKTQQKLAEVERARTEAIAIIGMGCRFPGGVTNPDELWALLANGVDGITEIPAERWDIDPYYDRESGAPGKMSTRMGGFLKEKDTFDPQFFGISPREAMFMDPQHRVVLEVAWEALEHAGINPEKLYKTTAGIFVGISTGDYLNIAAEYLPKKELNAYIGTGCSHGPAAGRISYVLGLTGPSIALDTACSASLSALHLACQSLRSRECHLALAGGVNMILDTMNHIVFSKAGMLSEDGRCKTFDESADGYGRSEGAGMVVLKRLSDALKDRDPILALIRGSAINQDGASGGLTVPNGPAQQAVIRQALSNAGLEPKDISYIEAHGTGTSLGDPIEMGAIGAVFSSSHSQQNPLTVASLKTNLGHMEAAAGIGGLIKVVLQLQHRKFAPHLHWRQPSSRIDWKSLPIRVPTTLSDWQTEEGQPRRAGLSSFGFSGTNAHLIIEEAPASAVLAAEAAEQNKAQSAEQDAEQDAEQSVQQAIRPRLLTITAKNPNALQQLAASYAERFRQVQQAPEAEQQEQLANICYTSHVGRAHFQHRLAVVASSAAQMQERLELAAEGKDGVGIKRGEARESERPRIAFLFTGQGSQWAGMGQQLYHTHPLFRQLLDQCQELLRTELDVPLFSLLWGNNQHLLEQTRYTQPALFALEYSLSQLWMSWGVRPSLLLGHSLGEYVAACLAGALTLEDALRLVCRRAELMQQEQRAGAMLSVWQPVEEVEQLLRQYKDVSIAAENTKTEVVISGAAESIAEIEQSLEAKGVRVQRLRVSHAFHSPLMEEMAEKYRAEAEAVKYEELRIAMVSNVSGAQEKEVSADYWVRQVRERVRFRECVEEMERAGIGAYIEVGPQPVLLRMVREVLDEEGGKGEGEQKQYVASMRRGRAEGEQLEESLGELYVRGMEVKWEEYEGEEIGRRRKESVPTYAFQRQNFWLRSPFKIGERDREDGSNGKSVKGAHPLLGQRMQIATQRHNETVFEAQIGPRAPEFLDHHQVFGTAVLPASGFLEMALAAGAGTLKSTQLVLEDVVVQEPLLLNNNELKTIQSAFNVETQTLSSFKIYSLAASDDQQVRWTLHAYGRVVAGEEAAGASLELAELKERCAAPMPVEDLYRQYQARGLEYGSAFRALREVWHGEGEALGRVALSEELRSDLKEYQLHPVALDACFQLLGVLMTEAEATFLPVGVERLRLYVRSLDEEFWCHARIREVKGDDGQMVLADLQLINVNGRLLAQVDGLQLVRTRRETLLRSLRKDSSEWFYKVSWQESEGAKEQPAATQEREAGARLIFADEGGVGDSLAQSIRARGERCVVVHAGADYAAVEGEADRYRLDPARLEHFQRLLKENFPALEADPQTICRSILYLWGMDEASEDGIAALRGSHLLGCGSVLNLIQAIARVESKMNPRLWLVTRGARAVVEDERVLNSGQAALWGLGQVVRSEHPVLNCSCIDLDPRAARADEKERQQLLSELTGQGREDQLAYRGGLRYVARLERLAATSAEPNRPSSEKAEPIEVKVKAYGSLENLTHQPLKRRRPDPGEVEVRVRCAGLNFKDVLYVLGMLKEHAEREGRVWDADTPWGFECSGTVVDVGEGVTHLKRGDGVIVQALGCFKSFVTVSADMVVLKPERLSFEEGAAIPTVFLTSYHALHLLAGIKPGDKVLIHAGAGGVGQAAIQLARRAGAEVFATASPPKWDFLKAQGVEHVMNSRTLDFAEEIMKLTNGRGVDVVLNSLNGDFIPKSLEVLAQNGRFIEIGKLGIWEKSRVAAIRPDVAYHSFDLSEATTDVTGNLKQILAEVTRWMEEGTLEPLPVKLFPLEEMPSALRFLAQAKNIGKVVLSMPEVNDRADYPASRTRASGDRSIRADATYLVTGGLGALGLNVAQWLIQKGAQHLILMSRSEPTDEARGFVESLEKAGAHVLLFRGDVSERADISRLLKNLNGSQPGLRGIIHAAGVLDDGILIQQDWQRFERVMLPKVKGAWNLHTLSRNLGEPLDFFVCFSSLSALLGTPGQGNYAAANAFMDALMYERQAEGLAGLSINWGPWSDVGMAARLSAQEWAKINSRGLEGITFEQGLQALEQLLTSDEPQVVVAHLDWARFLNQSTGDNRPPFFSVFEREEEEEARPQAMRANAGADLAFLEMVKAAPAAERRALLSEHARSVVANVLGFTSSAQIESKHKLFDLGIDSLMAVELKNRLESSLGHTLPTTLLFDYPTLEAMVEYLHDQLFGADASASSSEEAPVASSIEDADAHGDLQDIKGLSGSEVDRLYDELFGEEMTKEN